MCWYAFLAASMTHSACAKPRRGGAEVWKVVRVPSIADKDRRQLHRERLTRTRDRTRVLKRMTELLAGCRVRLARPGDVEAQLDQAHQWDGSALPVASWACLQSE